MEKSKDKAKKLVSQLVAVNQTTSVIIGRLIAVEIDKLWKMKYPYCRLVLSSSARFRIDGKFEAKFAGQEAVFVNKPDAIMSMQELKERFPKIYENAYQSGFAKSVSYS